MIQIKALYTMNICRFKSTLSVIRWSYTGTNRISHNYKYPGVTSFRRCKEQYYTRMLCQKKLNICINKILIYNRKWVRPLSSSQTRSKHRNYQATMCVLTMTSPIFSWENSTRGDQNVYKKFICFL